MNKSPRFHLTDQSFKFFFLEKLFRREKIFVVALENIGWFDRKHLFYLVFTGVGDAFFVLIQQFT